jgi:predicted Co/Zn/Cd cation transporter (cation efflux family)
MIVVALTPTYRQEQVVGIHAGVRGHSHSLILQGVISDCSWKWCIHTLLVGTLAERVWHRGDSARPHGDYAGKEAE